MARNAAGPWGLRLFAGLMLAWTITCVPEARAADKTSDSIGAEAPSAAVIDPTDEARLEHASGDPRRFALVLRELVERLRARALPGVEHKIARESEHAGAWVAGGIACASLLAFPYVIAASRRRRGQTRVATRFGYGALAAGLIFFGMSLLAGTLLVTKRLQALAGPGAGPRITAVATTLDALDDGAEDVATFGPAVATPTLVRLGRIEAPPLPASFVDDVGRRAPDAEGYASTFGAVAKIARVLDAGAEQAPLALVVLMVIVFLAALRPTLREILEMPGRASSDEAHVAAAVRTSIMIRVARELGITVVLAASTTALAFAASVAVSATVRPATRLILHYTLATGDWMRSPTRPSPTVMLAGMSAAAIFAALGAVLVVVACVAFANKTHRLLQQRAHEPAPLPSHAGFWTWAPCGMALVLLFPAVFGHAISALVEGPLTKAVSDGTISGTTFFVLAPAMLVLGFALSFWALRGFRALAFVARYALRPEAMPTTARSPSLTPRPVVPPPAPPAAATPIAVRNRYVGPPQLVTTLPSASSAPPPPLEGTPLGPLSTTAPSAVTPAELAVKKRKSR